jgi:hypothetical protein
MSDNHDTPELDEAVIVFQGDLFNCRERLRVLHEEEVHAEIIGAEGAVVVDGMPTMMNIIVPREDLELTIEIFADIWQETLSSEGLQEDEISELSGDVIDFSQDTIICPGCRTELSEVTEDGECPECGLFLGLPEDDDDEDDEEES